MKRRAKRRGAGASVRPAAPAAARPTRDRRIVPVDAAPLRQKAASEYTRSLAKLDRARAELRQFEQQDRPAFAAWLATAFGPLLTELRENARLIDEQEDLIAEVESEMIWSNHSNPRKAYAAVMRERENPGAGADLDEEEEPGGEPAPDISNEERRELFEDFVESIFGVSAKDLHPELYTSMFADFQKNALGAEPEPGPGESNQTPERPADPHEGRIKEIYRILVRRLHPDLRAGDDTAVSAVWHDVQEAYEARNLDRLETLLALTEAADDPAGGNASLSQLRAVLEELARALQAIQRSIREARRDPAWAFRLPTHNRAPVETRLRREMEQQLASQRWMLADLQKTLRDWSQPWQPTAKRNAKKTKRPAPEPMRSNPPQAEFDIFG